MEENKQKKIYKTFKEYYQDEDFKKKHQDYISQAVECECGKMITRSNLGHHKKTKLHEKKLEKKKTEELNKMNELKEFMEGLKEMYEKNNNNNNIIKIKNI